MAEYIEKDTVVSWIEKQKRLSKLLTIMMIQEQPAADVVPVVRCRHCQSHHWEQEPCHGKTVHYCEKLNAEVTADFFCAAGKRKDGDGND